jgi:hypothetical protein
MIYCYWAADCKTIGCKTNGCQNSRVIKFRGEYVEGGPELPVLLPEKIIVTCPVCSKSYEYEPAGISPVFRDYPPPIGFVDLF